MGKWSERITSHPIWDEMKSLGAVLDVAASKEINDSSTFEDIERFRSVLAYCGKRLASTDPILIQPTAIDPISTLFNYARIELEAYINDENPNHFITANLRIDELLVQLRNIPSPTSEELTFISDSITSYRNNLEKNLKEILEDQKTVRNALKNNNLLLSNQTETLNAEQQKLAVLASEVQTQFSTAQNTRASEFSTILADLQAKSTTSINENQTLFSNAQIANSEKIAGVIAEYSKEFETKLITLGEIESDAERKYETDLTRLKNKYEVTAKKLLTEITDQKKQVEKLVGVIGNLGVTSGYLKTANHARIALYIWQVLTVLALGGLICVAYSMAFPSSLSNVIQKTVMTTTQPTLSADSIFY